MTGLGLCCALGSDPGEVSRAIAAGRSAVGLAGDYRDRLGVGFAMVDVDVRPLLKRRKDRKLLPRSAHMALPAAFQAMGDDRPEQGAVYLGVGREPPEDATEATILASHRAGGLDVEALGTIGLTLYPPLASLRTLPNMVLAHIAIQLDLTGPCGTLAGDSASGLTSVVRAAHAVAEGRAEVALAGGADSLVHPLRARDAVRRGWSEPLGEGAAVLRLESVDRARARGAHIYCVLGDRRSGVREPGTCDLLHHRAVGRCGAADGAIALLLAISTKNEGRLHVHDETGAFAALCWGPSPEAIL
ncbi:MAG: 3-oxoacyl-[acyl-carrier-protein] synthase II [Kiritimatiellia bacterium]